MSYLEHSRYRGFDGVVLACIDFGDPEVIELVQSSIPVVTIDYLFNNRIAIMSDNVAGMKELLAVGKAAGMNAKNCKMIAEEIWEKTRTLEATYRGWKS